MSDAEAKKEHDEIQAEIAATRGATEPEIIETKEEEEPDAPSVDAEDDLDSDTEDEVTEEDIVDPPELDSKRHIPLAKFLDFKSKSRAEIQKLTEENERLKTARPATAEKKIEAFAEANSMEVEQVKGLIDLFREEMAPALSSMKKLETDSATATAKAAAIDAFETEFGSLLEEFPDADKESVRQLAYKPANLSKSLFEIYYKEFKPPAKRKTAESGRGNNRTIVSDKKDFAKIAEEIKNNVPNALGALSGEEQDAFFEWAKASGSRYTSKR